MGINTTVLRAKVKFKSALRRGKAYIMTARRKMALKAAQLASAAKRKGRMAVASVGGNTKMLRVKVAATKQVKKAWVKTAVKRAKSATASQKLLDKEARKATASIISSVRNHDKKLSDSASKELNKVYKKAVATKGARAVHTGTSAASKRTLKKYKVIK